MACPSSSFTYSRHSLKNFWSTAECQVGRSPYSPRISLSGGTKLPVHVLINVMQTHLNGAPTLFTMEARTTALYFGFSRTSYTVTARSLENARYNIGVVEVRTKKSNISSKESLEYRPLPSVM